MSNSKIFVFGKGFLGTRISSELGYRLIGRDEVDPSDFKSLEKFLISENPKAIINAAVKIGFPNSDWCENNKGATLESNIVIPANFSKICKERNIFFTQLSSGCIYNGPNGDNGFSELDPPNNYGSSFHLDTKIMAEKLLEGSNSLIIRLRLPIDVMPHPRNLITKLAKYREVIDEKNSITFVPDLIKVIDFLISNNKRGTYNVVNPGLISAKEIMKMYQEIVDPAHYFETIPLNKLNVIGKRSTTYLNTDKLNFEGISLPEIHEATRCCLNEYKKNLELPK